MQRKKIEFQKLVNRHNPYRLSVSFDVFQWMIATGWEYRERHGVFELLYGMSGHGAQFYNVEYGINKARCMHGFLKSAFVRAIVADDVPKVVLDWRKAQRIALGNYRMLSLPKSTVSYFEITKVLDDYVGKTTARQLNAFHPKANIVKGVRLSPNRAGWAAILRYGLADKGCSSAWEYQLTDGRQCFADVVRNAQLTLKELTDASL